MTTKLDVKKKLSGILEKVEGCPSCYNEIYNLLSMVDNAIENDQISRIKISYDTPHILIHTIVV
ncbi:MAG: hypothetical protein A2Z74_04650 [Chloroflexi bacterium RBG_13_46_9]|nr:MAG: hypothetical protein A2Z74_04650 [Chloroflexi bacterium RBG_13_46_9]